MGRVSSFLLPGPVQGPKKTPAIRPRSFHPAAKQTAKAAAQDKQEAMLTQLFPSAYGLVTHLIDVADGDGGEVDVTEGRRRRVHRRHHRRLVELHALH